MVAPIRPKDLDPGTPISSAALVFDSGTAVLKATPLGVMNAARPLASQAEAEAGADNAKIVSPLRVAQAIAAQALTPLSAVDGSNFVDFQSSNPSAVHPTGKVIADPAIPGLRFGDGVTPGGLILRPPQHVDLGYLNGVDDNRLLLDAVTTKYPLGGVCITWRGYLRLNAKWSPNPGCSNVVLAPQGDGVIYNPAHGFDFLELPTTVSGWKLDRVRFFTDTGASGATASYFLVNRSNDLICHDLHMRNMWSGIFTSGAKSYFLGRNYFNGMKATDGGGVVVQMGANEVCEIEAYMENAAGQDCKAAVQVLSGNAIRIKGIAAKCGTPLLIAPPTGGDTVATLSLDFNSDTSSGNGIQFAGSGVIQRVEGFIRASSNAGDGVRVENVPRSIDLKARAVQNGGRGVYLATAADQKNARYDVMAFGNGVHGFEAISGSTKWTARVIAGSGDDFGGNAQYGGVIGALCDNFTLDIDGVGDATALLFNAAGTGATKVVRSRS